mmetsp:Transcript_454/g.857  ORF Transcript_454/g.857 Transcript_454/m.857 type:complete len:241 (+) Transcript_454:709-1431(+)
MVRGNVSFQLQLLLQLLLLMAGAHKNWICGATHSWLHGRLPSFRRGLGGRLPFAAAQRCSSRVSVLHSCCAPDKPRRRRQGLGNGRGNVQSQSGCHDQQCCSLRRELSRVGRHLYSLAIVSDVQDRTIPLRVPLPSGLVHPSQHAAVPLFSDTMELTRRNGRTALHLHGAPVDGEDLDRLTKLVDRLLWCFLRLTIAVSRLGLLLALELRVVAFAHISTLCAGRHPCNWHNAQRGNASDA